MSAFAPERFTDYLAWELSEKALLKVYEELFKN